MNFLIFSELIFDFSQFSLLKNIKKYYLVCIDVSDDVAHVLVWLHAITLAGAMWCASGTHQGSVVAFKFPS